MNRQGKILAVDDNQLNIEVLEEALGDEYLLKTTTKGLEALKIAVDYQPDIVLLDIMMPEINGYEVCQQMRADPTLQYMKIIMVSAKAMTSERLTGYEAGADDYIVKPFDSDELLAKVRVYSRLRTLEEVECLNNKLESAIQELRRTNQELEEFAHIAAHDLKAPLRGIGSLVEWISTDYEEKFDEDGKQKIQMLIAKAGQMTTLIDDILRYSKLGREKTEKKPIDMNTVLLEVIDRIEQPDNIEITVEDKLPTLSFYETHVIQIFQNLIGNAVKYMDKSKGVIKVGCIEQDGYWKFSISDNGPGIDEKYFKKIFQMFQTLAPVDKTESTGIGLAIVKKIVDLNNGRVWLESQVGNGSTFFLTFPKQKAEVVEKVGVEDNSVYC